VIRVLLADDQALVRGGFRSILEGQEDIQVVGEAADGAEALEEALRTAPDVVLMDVRMPRVDGIEATRRMLADRRVTARVLMLTTFDHDEYVYEALRAGAGGFLLKSAPPRDLPAAVRTIAAGDSLLAPESAAPAGLAELTAREREVLELIARGRSNGEIAAELYLSQPTVKTHVSRILAKLGLRDRVQAVILAYESGLVQPGGH
jgi:DNA-binding NarL/FixJ family response regulator